MAFYQRSKICRLTFVALLAGCFLVRGGDEHPRRVVIVVWDGMRPDFVSEQNTPTLWKLAQDGVTFRNHHSVYLSATNVNGTAIATGDYPDDTGIIANHEFRPAIDKQKSVDVEAPATVAKGDDVSNGNYVAVPTIAELVRQAGGRTVVAGAKTVGLLLDRKVNGTNNITFAAGRMWPNESIDSLVAALGPFPKSHPEQDVWTTRALTDVFWKRNLPEFSMLWLGEPDLTQHEKAPGDPAALRAIKSSDDNLGAVLAALDHFNARNSTDIFVVSDHGFSTIQRSVDLRKILGDARFNVTTEFRGQPGSDEIMMVGVGGSVLFYLPKSRPDLGPRLVECLQQSDFAGVIFTRQKTEGTFSLQLAKIDSHDAPDIVMAFRWNNDKNQFGTPGMIDADWQRAAGKGTHATLSRFDMHNTLIAAGPDFQKGLASDLPSGNVDLAPTVLKILKMGGEKMDGRILNEALTDHLPTAESGTETLESAKELPTGRWHQTLKISHVGSTIYLDEGNGEFVRSGAPH